MKAKTENSARDRRSDETKIVEFELGCGELHEQLRGDWRVADCHVVADGLPVAVLSRYLSARDSDLRFCRVSATMQEIDGFAAFAL